MQKKVEVKESKFNRLNDESEEPSLGSRQAYEIASYTARIEARRNATNASGSPPIMSRTTILTWYDPYDLEKHLYAPPPEKWALKESKRTPRTYRLRVDKAFTIQPRRREQDPEEEVAFIKLEFKETN